MSASISGSGICRSIVVDVFDKAMNVVAEKEAIALRAQFSHVYDTPSDGNCLFWAFLFALFLPILDDEVQTIDMFYHVFGEDNLKHYENFLGLLRTYGEKFIYGWEGMKKFFITELRIKVVTFMRENEGDYRAFIAGSDAEWSSYLEKMSKPDQEWGDETEMKALSYCFKIPIHVVSKRLPIAWGHGYEFSCDKPFICLEHSEGVHYLFRLQSSLTFQRNLAKTPPPEFDSAVILEGLQFERTERRRSVQYDEIPPPPPFSSSTINLRQYCLEYESLIIQGASQDQFDTVAESIGDEIEAVLSIGKPSFPCEKLEFSREVTFEIFRRRFPLIIKKIELKIDRLLQELSMLLQPDFLPTQNEGLVEYAKKFGKEAQEKFSNSLSTICKIMIIEYFREIKKENLVESKIEEYFGDIIDKVTSLSADAALLVECKDCIAIMEYAMNSLMKRQHHPACFG